MNTKIITSLALSLVASLAVACGGAADEDLLGEGSFEEARPMGAINNNEIIIKDVPPTGTINNNEINIHADEPIVAAPAAMGCDWTAVPLVEANFCLQDLSADYPSGKVVLGNVPFTIPEDSINTWHSHKATNYLPGKAIFIVYPKIQGAAEVHTLINTAWGQSGVARASLEFFGSEGAYYRYPLSGNDDIRDFTKPGWTNLVNGATTSGVFVSANGKYRLDKQRIVLPKEFASQVLTEIRLNDEGAPNLQRTFLAGITVAANCVGDLQ